MSNQFTGRGNLGTDPELKSVTVGRDAKDVTEFRIYCDRLVSDGQDGFKDKGGFWMGVSVWGRQAQQVANVLKKGMRVYVQGTLKQETWSDKKSGDERSTLVLIADYVALDLGRIESVTMRQKDN